VNIRVTAALGADASKPGWSLPPDAPISSHCGQCSTYIDVCRIQTIVAPYWLYSRRCISYLKIELKGSI